MILCAGVSPAWQQVMVFSSFRYGEVNRADEVHWLAQGKVLNAGIAAFHLGGPSLTLAAGGGPPLEAIDRELERLGVPRRWVVTQAATRVCTTILDHGAGVMTELIENSRPMLPEELDAFRQAYGEEAARATAALITGSLPIGTPASFYRDLVERTPCPAVLDFRGEGLLLSLDQRPLVVKPNREELAQTVGKSLDTDQQLLDAVRLLNRLGAQWVVISQGAGPVWVASESKAYRLFPPPAQRIVNPLGCGDCMAAAIAWSIGRGSDAVEAVRMGIAAALENLAQLEIGRLDPARVAQQAQRVRVEEAS